MWQWNIPWLIHNANYLLFKSWNSLIVQIWLSLHYQGQVLRLQKGVRHSLYSRKGCHIEVKRTKNYKTYYIIRVIFLLAPYSNPKMKIYSAMEMKRKKKLIQESPRKLLIYVNQNCFVHINQLRESKGRSNEISLEGPGKVSQKRWQLEKV